MTAAGDRGWCLPSRTELVRMTSSTWMSSRQRIVTSSNWSAGVVGNWACARSEALRQAARAARSIARAGQQGQVQAFAPAAVPALYIDGNPLDVLSRAEKVELLKQGDQATRAFDSRIQQVTVSLAGV